MAPGKALGAAVIGLGIGRAHALAYRDCPGVELRAIADLDRSKAEDVKRELGGSVEIRDFDSIVADPAIDVISIASYDDAHADQVIAAFRHGKAVFVEKPICQTLSELQRIYRAWVECGKPPLASNLVLRSAPAYQWLRNAVQSGQFGEIYAVDGDYLYGRVHKITEGWRSEIDYYSVFAGGAIHLVDLMMWVLNERPEKVTAIGNQIATRGTKFRFRDFVSAEYVFKSGIVGRMTANFGCVHPHQHVLRVFGTKGTFLMDDQGPRVFWSREEDKTAEPLRLSHLAPSKGVLIPDFIQAIREKKVIETESRQHLDVLAAVLAADKSLDGLGRTEVEYWG